MALRSTEFLQCRFAMGWQVVHIRTARIIALVSLSAGTRLGVYEITSQIGAGGMGEVYRARDPRLGRDVALKILPDAFAGDPERLVRFEREAHLLASLNHPNIAIIHGFEESNGIRALVMELVEGPTLADRIAEQAGSTGPGLPVDEALPIARQIAEALEAAHERGIVHRDLKPANIKITPEGKVKVLDFGLGKLVDAGGAGTAAERGALSMSPTLSVQATYAGVILGTAAYMSPEQARGKPVDRRADIWAFGCVLFEMLTGRQTFETGETVSDAVAAVLKNEPDWTALPEETPPHIRTLLRRCLQKDPQKRLPHLGLARMEIEEAPASAPMPVADAFAGPALHTWRTRVRVAWSVAAVLFVAVIGLGTRAYFGRPPVDLRVTRTSILPPANIRWSQAAPATRFSLSPDGRRLAFLGFDENSRIQIWQRPLDAVSAQPLAGTEGAVLLKWSPDSRFLAFVAAGKLRKIDASGGPAIALADAFGNQGMDWNSDDVILFTPSGQTPLFRVAAAGGEASPVTTLDKGAGEIAHWQPFFLPDGRHFLYHSVDTETGAIYVGSLDRAEKPRLLLRGGSNAQYASGYLLFMRENSLMAQRFDPNRFELSGEARPLAERVQVGGTTLRTGAFSVSSIGSLIYQTGSTGVRSELDWFDRTGRRIGALGEAADQGGPELSPDGLRAVVSVLDTARRPVTADLWMFDIRRQLRTRFTFDAADEAFAAWSPHGADVVFSSSRKGKWGLYRKMASGIAAETAIGSDDIEKLWPSWSPDSNYLTYGGVGGGVSSSDLWVLPLSGDTKPAVLVRTEFNEIRPRVSPNGRWVAYESNESGRPEIYVTSFPSPAGKWQISAAGGSWPRWRRDGREIYYVSPDNKLMAAAVGSSGTEFQVGAVESLFDIRPRTANFRGFAPPLYDVTADGQRFLVNTMLEESSNEPVTLLVNWAELLKN